MSQVKTRRAAMHDQNCDYSVAVEKARKWIERNTVLNHGITITSRQRRIYQEVTGYYIPTLLKWGMHDKASGYARWLCRVQQASGAWLSADLKHESVFNTGQVLRGLIEIYDSLPEVKDSMIKGADWLVSNMDGNGRLTPAEGTSWSEGVNSELIHLYCLPPLQEIGRKLNLPFYEDCVKRILNYYKKEYREDIRNFNYLSHFYAYVMEALVDLGEYDIAGRAMKKIERIQRADGAVPAYKDVRWVCSTGLFQFAIVWFKLGQYRQGRKALDYAVKLQNPSGGWYGGYPLFKNRWLSMIAGEKATYFPDEEISWAVKYFLDALYYRDAGRLS